MTISPVNSKEFMLNPQDIFAVAAHEYKDGIEFSKRQAKKLGMSPERLNYIVMVNEYSDPNLIRIRCGNTLFTIAALPSSVGFVRGYNADTAQNYIDNMIELNMAAKNMGFKALVAHTTHDVVRAIKLAMRKADMKNYGVHFDSEQKLVAIVMGGGK